MTLDYDDCCLIGSSGLIGQNLQKERNFQYLINSKNLESIKYKNIDFVICAAPSAVKWKINMDRTEDLYNVNIIVDTLSTINCKKIVLCSTVDVYGYEINYGLNEDNKPNYENNHNYGKNRILLEDNLLNIFGEKLTIIRLSGLFGPFLKKNILFDIKNNNIDMLSNINFKSALQWYNLKNIYNDISNHLDKKIINLVNEPIKNEEIIKYSNLKINNNQDAQISEYNIKTKYSNSGYFNNKENIILEIDNYLKT